MDKVIFTLVMLSIFDVSAMVISGITDPLSIPVDADIEVAEKEIKEALMAKRRGGEKINRSALLTLMEESNDSVMKLAIAKMVVHNTLQSKSYDKLPMLWNDFSKRFGVAFSYSAFFSNFKVLKKLRAQSPGDRNLNIVNSVLEEVRTARQQRVELRKETGGNAASITYARLGDMCVTAGDWRSAMDWYSKCSGDIRKYAIADSAYLRNDKSEVSKVEVGDFWWARSESNSHYIVLAWIFRMRAVSLYDDALSEDAIDAVKKSVVQARISKMIGKSDDGGGKQAPVKKVKEVVQCQSEIKNPDECGEKPDSTEVKAGSVLTGTQTSALLTLGPKKTYIFKNQYIVPEGCVLILNEGTQLVFEAGGGMTIRGKLVVCGTKKKPVIFRGASTGLEIWEGVKFFGRNGSSIVYAHFSGAKEAINLSGAEISVSHSTFYRNRKMLYSHRASSVFEDCMVCENVEGVWFDSAGVDFRRCTFMNNEKFAIRGCYYGDVRCNACSITNNGSGIRDGAYDGTASAHQSCIYDNKEYDVACYSTKAGEFSENYWGPALTSVLKKEGDGYRPQSIKGNFVDISKFLLKPPKDCGAYDAPALIQR